MTRRPKIGKSSSQRATKRKNAGPLKPTLTERLGRPVLDPDLVGQLHGPLRRKAFADLREEIEQFRSASSAMQRSHRYQRLALGKVYEVWRELVMWEPEDRGHLLAHLNHDNPEKTERGSGIHVLLRALIAYESKPNPDASKTDLKKARQAALARVGRDAAAIKFAMRQNVQTDGFADFVARYPGGLDRMAKDESLVHRGGQLKLPARYRPKKVKLTWPVGLEDAVARRLAAGESVAVYLASDAGALGVQVACAHALSDSVDDWQARMSETEEIRPSP